MNLPNISFSALADGTAAVFVHLDGKVRSIFCSMGELPARVTSVAIAEFGLAEAEASCLSAQVAGMFGNPLVDPVALSVLQSQLADAEQQAATLESELTGVKSQLASANDQVATLTTDLTGALLTNRAHEDMITAGDVRIAEQSVMIAKLQDIVNAADVAKAAQVQSTSTDGLMAAPAPASGGSV